MTKIFKENETKIEREFTKYDKPFEEMESKPKWLEKALEKEEFIYRDTYSKENGVSKSESVFHVYKDESGKKRYMLLSIGNLITRNVNTGELKIYDEEFFHSKHSRRNEDNIRQSIKKKEGHENEK